MSTKPNYWINNEPVWGFLELSVAFGIPDLKPLEYRRQKERELRELIRKGGGRFMGKEVRNYWRPPKQKASKRALGEPLVKGLVTHRLGTYGA